MIHYGSFFPTFVVQQASPPIRPQAMRVTRLPTVSTNRSLASPNGFEPPPAVRPRRLPRADRAHRLRMEEDPSRSPCRSITGRVSEVDPVPAALALAPTPPPLGPPLMRTGTARRGDVRRAVAIVFEPPPPTLPPPHNTR